MFDEQAVACPACTEAIGLSQTMFSSDFVCPHCNAALQVPTLYTRSIVLLAVLLGYVLAWKLAIFGLKVCFGLPLGFFLFCIPLTLVFVASLLRVVPLLIRPRLVLKRPNELTTLNLTVGCATRQPMKPLQGWRTHGSGLGWSPECMVGHPLRDVNTQRPSGRRPAGLQRDRKQGGLRSRL